MKEFFKLVTILLPLTAFCQIGWIEHQVSSSYNGAFGIHTADVDGDGDTDLVSASVDDDEITWWENIDDFNFIQHVIDPFFDHAHKAYGFDIDQDNDMDVLGTAFYGDEIAWYANDGQQNFTKYSIRTGFDGARDAYAADIDGDTDLDVVGCAQYDQLLCWWENDGYQNFIEHLITNNTVAPHSIYPIDVDSDDDMDIVFGDRDADEVSWFENDGSQIFTRHIIDLEFTDTWDVFAIDLDLDNDIDILGAAQHENDVWWWENDGEENFQRHIIPGESTVGSRNVHAVDLNNDGNLDIVAAFDNCNAIFYYENDGQQNFTEYCMTNYFNDAFDLWPGDFNDDGNLDIAGTAYGGDAVSVWENVPIELELILEPYFPPVQIPPQGGSFDFGLVIRNHSQFNLNFNGWIEIELPGGASIHTISLRNDMMVSANDSLVWWDMLQNVPANAPSGLYQYIAKIGTHPYSVWQQDQFQVDKTGAFVNSERDWDFTLTGWITQVENPYESLKIGEYGLITANPNPFNPTTILSYELRVAGSVLLTVYDIQGREAARLVNGWQEAGIHKVTFDGADLSSGIYFVRLQAGEFTALQKLVLLK